MDKRQAKKEALRIIEYMLDANTLALTGVLEGYPDKDHDKVVKEIKAIKQSLMKRRIKLS